MLFLTLFAIPVLMAIVVYAFWHHEITPTELFIQVAAVAAIAAISATIIYHQNTDDSETVNGHVTGKHMEEVPCSHSYSCHCHTTCFGSGKSRSCTTHCQTCYVHYRGSPLWRGTDFSWFLDTTLGQIYINRIDLRGENEPPRYTKAKPLDPVAATRDYENYIKAAPGTLLKHEGLTKKFARYLPVYPQSVYDYHYMNRLVSVVPLKNPGYWNRELGRLNDHIAVKSANVVLVLAGKQPQEYAYALEQHWIGGKKNDVIVVIGTNETQINWVYVMTWSKNELFKVHLRNDLLELGSITDLHKVLAVIEDDTLKMFTPRNMHDFEYLKSSITPTTSQWFWSLIISTIVSLGLSFLFSHPEVNVSITGDRKTKKYPYQF